MQTLFSEDKPMAKNTSKKKITKKPGRKRKVEQPLTTAQQLGSLIKSARDIMRKDKGLNGDLDRLPMLTWIMFLKFLDDMEQVDEEATKLEGKKYKPVIESPYRWRDWATKADGITGDELIAFVNQEEAVRPNGSKGPGLLAYLRSLQSTNGKSRRDVVAQVFSGVVNRMISGYLLRDVINKVDGIHFSSSEELHTLGALYESMLREMRDAAGDSGEFYTPRPVVQFMVAVTNPQLGETVLDPACGTGGFLAEAYEHLAKQVETTKDRRVLQEQSLFGQEAKPLPYMLGQMNLLLHGLEYPSIAYGNTLARKVTEIGDRDRFDVILTNPPFGGEEEAGIKNNFPADKQTSETAILFLQLIMRMLKRPEKNNGLPGRAAVVVPNGTLSAPGVAARVRADLLRDFRVTAVLRLPHNVFAPYTDIRTNILFFERGGPTEAILYCEPPLPDGVSLSKTKPLDLAWLKPYLGSFRSGTLVDEHCWNVLVSELDEDLNLDQKNPLLSLDHLDSSEKSFERLVTIFQGCIRDTESTRLAFETIKAQLQDAPRKPLGELTAECDDRIGGDYTPDTRLLGVSNVDGFCIPKTPIGKSPGRYKIIRPGYLAYNPMRINIGSIGVAGSDLDAGITSPDYVVFRCKPGLSPRFVYHYLRSEAGRHEINQKTRGSVRFRLYYDRLAEIPIPVPSDPAIQERFADVCDSAASIARQARSADTLASKTLDAVCRDVFIA